MLKRLLVCIWMLMTFQDVSGEIISYVDPAMNGGFSIDSERNYIYLGDVAFAYEVCSKRDFCVSSKIFNFSVSNDCVIGDKWRHQDLDFEVVGAGDIVILGHQIDNYCLVKSGGEDDGLLYGYSPSIGLIFYAKIDGGGAVFASSLPAMWGVSQIND